MSQGTHSIVAAYAGDAGNAASSSSPLSQVINAAGASNVALASNGGVASASSTYSAAFPIAAVNNNERAGINWGNGGGWNDATANTFPDIVSISFNGSKTINRVVVYTLQDNFTAPVEPTDSMTFTLYGITTFTVQGRQGTKWITLASVPATTWSSAPSPSRPSPPPDPHPHHRRPRFLLPYHRDRGLGKLKVPGRFVSTTWPLYCRHSLCPSQRGRGFTSRVRGARISSPIFALSWHRRILLLGKCRSCH